MSTGLPPSSTSAAPFSHRPERIDPPPDTSVRRPGGPLESAERLLSAAVELSAKLGAVALTLIVLAEVLARYVLDAPLTWTAELAGFVLVWVVMLGITLGVREGSHYGVQLLANRLPARPRVAAEAVRDAATIGFFLVMAWEGFQAMRVNGDISSSVLNIPLSWIYLAFVVSGVIGAVNAINRIAHHATRPARAIATALVIIAVMATLLVVFYVSETLILPVVLVTAVVLLVVGTPIAIVIGMSVMVGIQLTRLASLEIAVEQMFNAIDNFTLIAVPFFMLTGTILLETRLADRLIDFAMILVGRSRGGLAYVDIVASCLFADISGSSTSDTAAIGSTMIPGMAAAGYRREFATGLQAASGSMGMLVPPSTCTIIYATVAGVSVLDMFAASILPALLMACSFALVVFWYARRSGLPKGPRIGIRDAVHKLRRAILPLLTPVIILAGIFSGAITAAEAGAVAVAYSVLAAAGSRSLSRQNGSRALATGTRNFSIVFFVISTAMLLSYVLSYEQIPQSVARITLGLSSKAIIVLLMIMVVMVVIHTVLEAVATILIVTPIFVPPLMEMGVSPIHFGVLLMMNSSIGLILPPIGLCLYISSAIGKVPIERAAKAVIPFASVIACDLVILIVFPQISTVVPHLLGR